MTPSTRNCEKDIQQTEARKSLLATIYSQIGEVRSFFPIFLDWVIKKLEIDLKEDIQNHQGLFRYTVQTQLFVMEHRTSWMEYKIYAIEPLKRMPLRTFAKGVSQQSVTSEDLEFYPLRSFLISYTHDSTMNYIRSLLQRVKGQDANEIVLFKRLLFVTKSF